MKLIVQIPAYNEEQTIGKTIADIPRKIAGIDLVEVVVVDDGSSDKTVDAAKRAGADHVVRLLTHRGLATTFVAGLDAALHLGADIIVNTDADNQYRGADIAKLVAPIVNRSAEVVIGDRDVVNSPHMGPLKKMLQKLGSRAVGFVSGMAVPDATSGFRAFSREAAFQINVFNPFTYTLETIIQAGNRNFGVKSVVIGTNKPTRPSRLYQGIASYVRKSLVTMFRVYTIYKPLKTFFAIGAMLFLAGVALGVRFLYFFAHREGGHVQSLILASVLLLAGFQTILIGLVADLISVNRRLSEEVLIRMKKLGFDRDRREQRERRPANERRQNDRRHEDRAAREQPLETQWIWLVDEAKIEDRIGESSAQPQEPITKVEEPRRRRRRRRRPDEHHFAEGRKHHEKPKPEGGDGPQS